MSLEFQFSFRLLRWLVIAGLGVVPLIRLFAAAAEGTPTPRAGWKMELFASAPAIKHPSVVVCSPDGKVFVAEDPMDITRPANVPEGRIVCFHPDGRMTVFAEKLHAVFGMQYLEGRLYVLHNPKFSVFHDENGIGTNRRDILEQTNPNPWALDWNDHVPANFRLGMDNRFYIAVGDKGIYGAVGTDGSRINMRGGGIIRMRPDGSELEIYSTGVRNILDVGMTSEDDLFTYDNTDENQWMGRVTHMVDGGFYGYPFDFIPQRPYTLWMMADYGAGAATGIEVSAQDALPEPMQGNLFLADFGQRNVRRVPLIRSGATFKPGQDEQLFLNPPGDFRPVGLAFSDDGSNLFICDWQHRDTKEDAVAGRVWKLSWTDKSNTRARPAWYRDAAMGKPVKAPISELLAALSHPSRNVRMTAQRTLAANGGTPDVQAALSQLIAAGPAPGLARIHAIWASDAIDGGTAASGEILKAARDPDRTVARQAIRQLGNRGRLAAFSTLAELTESTEKALQFEAVTALGRLGDERGVPHLIAAALSEELFTFHAAFRALNRIARRSPGAWKTITAALADTRARIRDAAMYAMRETYDDALIQELSAAFQVRTKSSTVSAELKAACVRAVSPLQLKPDAWNGEWWAYHPFRLNPPQKTNAWSGTSQVRELLQKALNDESEMVRESAVAGIGQTGGEWGPAALAQQFEREKSQPLQLAMLSVLGQMKASVSQTLAIQILQNTNRSAELRRSALALARSIGGREVVAAVMNLIKSPEADPEFTRELIATLGALKATESVELLKETSTNGPAGIKSSAIEALGKIGVPETSGFVAPFLNSSERAVQISAVRALAAMKATNQIEALLTAAKTPELQAEITTALLAMPDPRAVHFYVAGLESRKASTRAECRRALAKIRDAVLPELLPKLSTFPTDTIAELQQIYRGNEAAKRGGLFNMVTRRPDRDAYFAYGTENRGDALRGEKVFKDLMGAACINCHKVKGDGNDVGPDLSGIGAQFDRRAIAESILWPSRAVREGYAVVEFQLKDGEEISGMIRAESAEFLTLQPASGPPRQLPKSSISTRKQTPVSLMPEGLESGLSLEEFADLLDFLQSLRSGT